jgi:hypothetical protein
VLQHDGRGSRDRRVRQDDHPGFVDMHAHHYREWRGMRPKHDFEQAIYLAYGVTTTLDPSMYSVNMFPTAELIEAGG